MSVFEGLKEKASDVAEDVKHTVTAGVEKAKAEAHEAKVDRELREVDRTDPSTERRDRLKP